MSHTRIAYIKDNQVIDCLMASVDHKLPLVEGGTNAISNLVPACRYCNELRAGHKVEREDSVSLNIAIL